MLIIACACAVVAIAVCVAIAVAVGTSQSHHNTKVHTQQSESDKNYEQEDLTDIDQTMEESQLPLMDVSTLMYNILSASLKASRIAAATVIFYLLLIGC